MPKITALPAAASVTADDLLPIVNDPGGAPVTQKATGTQLLSFILGSSADTRVLFNDAGVVGGDADLTWNKTTNLLSIVGGISMTAEANETPLTISGYSLTGVNAQSMVSWAGTLNTSGNPSVLRLAVTDTASGATTKLLELIAGAGGATSMFSVNRVGQVILASGTAALPAIVFSADAGLSTGIYRQGAGRIGFSTLGTLVAEFNGSILELKAAVPLSFNAVAFLVSDASNSISSRNGTNAQSFLLYRTFTNSTNYERLALQSAAGQMIVAAETAGTGTDDLDLTLTPAGVGRVRFGTNTALAAETVTSYIIIKDSGGTERKLAVVS